MSCVLFIKPLKSHPSASPRPVRPVHRCSPPAVRQWEAPAGGGPHVKLAGAGGKVTPPAKCSRITMPMCTC